MKDKKEYREQAEYQKEYYEKNRESLLEKKRAYHKQRRKDNPEIVKANDARKRNSRKDKEKVINKLNWAVKTGKVKRPEKCRCCGQKGKVQGHHSDYDKPLDVIWLCNNCHNFLHSQLNAQVPIVEDLLRKNDELEAEVKKGMKAWLRAEDLQKKVDELETILNKMGDCKAEELEALQKKVDELKKDIAFRVGIERALRERIDELESAIVKLREGGEKLVSDAVDAGFAPLQQELSASQKKVDELENDKDNLQIRLQEEKEVTKGKTKRYRLPVEEEQELSALKEEKQGMLVPYLEEIEGLKKSQGKVLGVEEMFNIYLLTAKESQNADTIEMIALRTAKAIHSKMKECQHGV